jgi:hypothetical protein
MEWNGIVLYSVFLIYRGELTLSRVHALPLWNRLSVLGLVGTDSRV